MYKDKEKQKEYAAKHYQINKEKMIEKAKNNNILAIARNKKYIEDYLDTHPCIDCGETNKIVLEFDHIKGTKKNNISCLKKQPVSLETIKKEVEKCEVRCANCHRIVTYNRRKEKSGSGEN